MSAPRVLMISTHGYVAAQPELGKPDTGGQVVYVLELSKALARQGFEVDILTRRFDGRAEQEFVAEGVHIIRVPCGGNDFVPKETLAHQLPDLIDGVLDHPRLSQHNYALINSHYWDSGVVGAALARAWEVPHLHTPHSMGLLKRQNQAWGESGESASDNLDERIRRERMIYHQADLLIPTAGEQTRCLNESDEYNVSLEKIAQIPPGFDDRLFYRPLEGQRIVVKEMLGWAAPTILAAGRLAPNKGYDLLVKAFPAVLRRISEARLVLATGGENQSPSERAMTTQLKLLAGDLGIGSRVQITACVPQARLADYYRAADVFVLCSRHEPFGMTAIEAMACGTPTVVTTHGGLWEEMTWGHDAIYCDPLDAEALAHAICSPLQHPRIRQQLSRQGAATVRERYTWDQVASQLLNRCSEEALLESADYQYDATSLESA